MAFLIAMMFIFNAYSYDHVIVTQTAFSASGVSIEKNLEDTLLNPEGFLKRFNPAGVEVTKKVIKGNDFEFVVVKRIIGISKTFHLLGSIRFERTQANCPANQVGYLGQIDFTPSGPYVTNTIENFTLLFCGSSIAQNKMSIKSTNTLFYLGDKFGSLLEKFSKSLITEQVDTLSIAIKNEALSL